MAVYAVIIAGGAGTRLWPLSRRGAPKPFLPVRGGASLLRATYERARRLAEPARVLAVVARDLAPKIREALPGLPPENLLGEPVGRNTAAAIGLAAAVARARDPEAQLAVLPADHVISDEEGFAAAAKAALALAARGEVVTIGIAPTRPETGYGYLKLGEPLPGGGRRVSRFVEKPSRETAEEYLASGEYLWNSGTFFFAADRILRAIAEHLPELSRGLAEIVAEGDLNAALDRHFPKLPSISIDYGVMERLPEAATVPGRFGWDDVGTLAAYAEVGPAAAPIEVSASGNVVIGAKRLVAVVGADDLVIVETDDALLICRRGESQRVREVVQVLEKQGRDELL